MVEKKLIEKMERLQKRVENLEQELENHTHLISGSRCYYSHNQVLEPCRALSLRDARIKEIEEEFEQEYVHSKPYSDYIVWCKLTERSTVEYIKKGRSSTVLEVKEELRQAGEDPEEEYILVGLKKSLPKSLSIPQVYKGIKVYAGIVDEKGVIGLTS